MTVISLATNVGNGVSEGVAVPESSCYIMSATWTGAATVVMEVSVDGTNYFVPYATGAAPSISNTGGVGAWRLLDVPVQSIRIRVTGLTGDNTVSATVIAA